MCGGNILIFDMPSRAMGLSPLVRGKLDMRRLGISLIGSIPACAGETTGRDPAVLTTRVYPRLCGGNF